MQQHTLGSAHRLTEQRENRMTFPACSRHHGTLLTTFLTPFMALGTGTAALRDPCRLRGHRLRNGPCPTACGLPRHRQDPRPARAHRRRSQHRPSQRMFPTRHNARSSIKSHPANYGFSADNCPPKVHQQHPKFWPEPVLVNRATGPEFANSIPGAATSQGPRSASPHRRPIGVADAERSAAPLTRVVEHDTGQEAGGPNGHLVATRSEKGPYGTPSMPTTQSRRQYCPQEVAPVGHPAKGSGRH